MLARFHPLVRQWFEETLGKPSDPQRKGWRAIASGAHTLILAPTGTGKTLAAFLWELNELIVEGIKEPNRGTGFDQRPRAPEASSYSANPNNLRTTRTDPAKLSGVRQSTSDDTNCHCRI